MALLTAHLLESGDHGRLGFHPRCPVCRDERLFGRLPADAVVSLRARAALASGVLAVSAAGPSATALAQEPDQRSDAVTAPPTPDSGADENLGFTPGGEVQLPGESAGQAPPTTTEPAPPTGPPPEDDPQDALPLESEPVQDPVPAAPEEPVPSDDATPEPSYPNLGADLAEPAPATPTESSPDDLIFDGEEEPAPSTEDPPSRDAAPTGRDADRPPKPDTTGPGERNGGTSPTQAPGAAAPALTEAAPPPVADAPASAPTQPAAAQDPEPPIDGRTHLVRPGDSLWSIAKRVLGPDASAAQIARKVHRLWTLNADRIGTGDPDLLMVGTELRLR